MISLGVNRHYSHGRGPKANLLLPPVPLQYLSNLNPLLYLKTSLALSTAPNMSRRESKWSWTHALVGAASATAAFGLLSAKPKDPTFDLISIDLTSFKLNLPLLDADLILTVHVTNPNVVPIHYSSSTMSIFYKGSLLGSADVKAGSQSANSCKLLRLPARLDGLQLAHHAASFVADVAKREMVLDAAVDIAGAAKVLWWDHKFVVHVDSHVRVDPLFLDVVEQENKSELDLFVC